MVCQARVRVMGEVGGIQVEELKAKPIKKVVEQETK